MKDVLKYLNLGNSFRLFGGVGFVISIWSNSTLGLKLSLITFIFGAIARIIEAINQTYPSNKMLHHILYSVFLILYFRKTLKEDL